MFKAVHKKVLTFEFYVAQCSTTVLLNFEKSETSCKFGPPYCLTTGSFASSFGVLR